MLLCVNCDQVIYKKKHNKELSQERGVECYKIVFSNSVVASKRKINKFCSLVLSRKANDG